jgi:hypothetical protein
MRRLRSLTKFTGRDVAGTLEGADALADLDDRRYGAHRLECRRRLVLLTRHLQREVAVERVAATTIADVVGGLQFLDDVPDVGRQPGMKQPR